MRSTPLIGILTRSYCSYGKQSLTRYGVLQKYVRVIGHFGGDVILIPPQNDLSLTNILTHINGVMLVGGNDISFGVSKDQRYSNIEEFDLERDEAEAVFTKMALEKDLPILGICRGMQMINLVKGGTILDDIYESHPNALRHSSSANVTKNQHLIKIVPKTRLSVLAGQHGSCQVNSSHHQSIKKCGEDIIPSAFASDGIVEAIECTSKRYVLGVQWHPEWMPEDELSKNIFSSFISAARSPR